MRISYKVRRNKVQVRNTARENKEHMEAGSEGNKRRKFTINNIQGWELITTKFECRNWESWQSCGGGGNGYWNPEWGQNLSAIVCECYGM